MNTDDTEMEPVAGPSHDFRNHEELRSIVPTTMSPREALETLWRECEERKMIRNDIIPLVLALDYAHANHIHKVDKDGKIEEWSLLKLAAFRKHMLLFGTLIREGCADPTIIFPLTRSNLLDSLVTWDRQIMFGELCLNETETPASRSSFLNNTNQKGWTPLMVAARLNHVRWTKWLLNKGAGANVARAALSSITPMHVAAKKGHIQVLELLLDAGGNKNQLGHHCQMGNVTPMDMAKKGGISAVLQLLNKYK